MSDALVPIATSTPPKGLLKSWHMKISCPAPTVKVPIVMVAVFGSLASAAPEAAVPVPALPVAALPGVVLPAAALPVAAPPGAVLPGAGFDEVAPLSVGLAIAAACSPPWAEPVPDEPHATEKVETITAATCHIFIGVPPFPELPKRSRH